MMRLRIVDSHTGGEPTRVVIEGGPDLGDGPLDERRALFKNRYDEFRSAVVNEPRASDAVVGAWLVRPRDPSCVTGVIFFNNAGFIGMCGHGTIGLAVTLAHLGRIRAGEHRIETPVGIVTARLHEDGTVSVTNVESFRNVKGFSVELEGVGTVKGDVAWGGNWFYLVESHGQQLSFANVGPLTDYCERLRRAVNAHGHPEVDHVELFGPPQRADADARNFVLCPGLAYDRSPCGTGTSAKLACLAADGKLAEGAEWVQESIIGSAFRASYRRSGEHIVPTIRGSAFVNAEGELLLDERDPFCFGIRR
ncbi:MAG TPA: proline racemase family protein [Steroidobacteraceae bacterium]|jgi:4-hydroxyproline epimerase|nr:proline racemase family protein [Steroidobacteraceae bacterium]